MKTYFVIADFYDKETGELITAGETFEADDERYQALKAAGVIGKEVIKSDDDDDVEGLKKLGGGYYELPNGEKVRGKEKAIEALKALEAGDDDGNQSENGDAAGDGAGNAGGGEGVSQD